MKDFRHEHPSRAASLSLLGGCACLDFVNTASGRGSLHHREHLQQPEHLADWSAHAGLLLARQCRQIKSFIRANRTKARELLRLALELREAIYVIGCGWAKGKPAPLRQLQILSQAYAEAVRTAKLVERDGRVAWTWHEHAEPGMALIGLLAQSAVELLSSNAKGRVKQCAGADCGWLFLDTSRNNSRRWCDMEVCGNRAKVRRFRGRAAEKLG
jgi:predicted RNA-binding Zn ribbon-like protein